MTREEQLDWLCRLRSEIYVYMPKEWLIPMNNALDMAIKALEQESRWIPISERLPEEHICDDGFHEPSKSVLVQMKSGEMHTAQYWSRYDERWLDLNYPTTDEVIAWMPLPEPYREVKE